MITCSCSVNISSQMQLRCGIVVTRANVHTVRPVRYDDVCAGVIHVMHMRENVNGT